MKDDKELQKELLLLQKLKNDFERLEKAEEIEYKLNSQSSSLDRANRHALRVELPLNILEEIRKKLENELKKDPNNFENQQKLREVNTRITYNKPEVEKQSNQDRISRINDLEKQLAELGSIPKTHVDREKWKISNLQEQIDILTEQREKLKNKPLEQKEKKIFGFKNPFQKNKNSQPAPTTNEIDSQIDKLTKLQQKAITELRKAVEEREKYKASLEKQSKFASTPKERVIDQGYREDLSHLKPVVLPRPNISRADEQNIQVAKQLVMNNESRAKELTGKGLVGLSEVSELEQILQEQQKHVNEMQKQASDRPEEFQAIFNFLKGGLDRLQTSFEQKITEITQLRNKNLADVNEQRGQWKEALTNNPATLIDTAKRMINEDENKRQAINHNETGNPNLDRNDKLGDYLFAENRALEAMRGILDKIHREPNVDKRENLHKTLDNKINDFLDNRANFALIAKNCDHSLELSPARHRDDDIRL